MFLWLKTLYRKRAVTWPFIFYTIIWTLSFLSKQLKTEQVRKVYQVVILLVVLINVYNGVQLI